MRDGTLVKLTLGRRWLLWTLFGASALVTAWSESEVLWVFLLSGLIGLFAATSPRFRYRDADGVAVLLSLAATLPFYVRRRLPLGSKAYW